MCQINLNCVISIENFPCAHSHRISLNPFRHLEAEVSKWQGLVDKVRGDSPPDFDNQTLAVLRGRLVRYLMRSKEVRESLWTCSIGVSLPMNIHYVQCVSEILTLGKVTAFLSYKSNVSGQHE